VNPLEQLADINTPNTVAWWPLAWGYWLVMALVICVIAGLIYAYIKYRQQRIIKKEALKSIAKLALQDPYYAHKAQVILKRTCSHYFAAQCPAQLSSSAWLAFLEQHYRGKSPENITLFVKHIHRSLYQAQDVAQISDTTAFSNEQLGAAVSDWIKHSVPAKPKAVSSNKPVTKELARV